MRAGPFRRIAALAVTLTVFAMPAARADESQVLQRLDDLEHRFGALEKEVRDRDAIIDDLQTKVKERDATIDALRMQVGGAPSTQAAGQSPAAGGQPPTNNGTDSAVPIAQRLDNLERTVGGLKEQASQTTAATHQPDDVKVTTKGGLKAETTDGQFSFQPIGRFHFDTAFYDQDKTRMGDGSQVRRARLGAMGKMFGDWQYKLEVDFARDTAAGTVGVKDAYIAYLGWNPAQIMIGNFKEPFSLNNLTSTNYLPFIERPLPITQPTSSLIPDRHMGIAASHYDSNWSASTGAFMKHTDDSQPANEGDQPFDLAARVTYDPVLEKDRLVHVGLSGLYRNPNDASVAFSLKPESNVTGARFLNTATTPSALTPGALTAVDHLYDVAPELALVYGPASFDGEYFWVPISQHQHTTCPNPSASAVAANLRRCPDVTLTGWFAEFSYFLTGESRPYNAATARWDRLMPNHNLGKGGFGAVELAARVSNADFDDGPEFQKGTETNYTLGLNWYVNPYIRFMANYIWVRNNASALGNAGNLLSGNTAGYDDPQIMEFRAQVDW